MAERKTIRLGIIYPHSKEPIYHTYVLTKAMEEDLNRYGFILPERRLIRVKKR